MGRFSGRSTVLSIAFIVIALFWRWLGLGWGEAMLAAAVPCISALGVLLPSGARNDSVDTLMRETLSRRLTSPGPGESGAAMSVTRRDSEADRSESA